MTPYQRLARDTPDFKHWRLPVAVIIGLGAYVIVSIVLLVGWLVGLLIAGEDEEAWLDSVGTQIALDRPSELAFQLVSIAAMLPCVLVAVALVWRRHVGFLHSVQGRLRWGWLGRCTALAFVVVAVSLALSLGLEALGGEQPRLDSVDGTGVTVIALATLCVPFQAAAEEYVFRGLLLQVIGSWTRRAWIPVLATSLIFAAGHVYDLWGLLSVFLFGVVAAVMTIRTGGLEAAIGLHVANNLVLMVLDVLGLVDAGAQEGGSWVEVVSSTAMVLVFWAIVERMASRRRLVRRREPLPEPPPVPQWVVVPPPPYVPPGHPPAMASHPPPPRPEVPPNAPPYPGDPGVWGR